MSARPARHLQLVDTNTGEIVESQELGAMQHELEELRTKFKMAQRDVAAKNLRIANLEADKARERLDYERYEDVKRIATYWHRKCRAGSKRVNPMSPDRFDAVRGILEQQEIVYVEVPGRKKPARKYVPKYSMAECKAAVDGAHFDHYVSKRRNGSEQHYDDLELIFRSGAKFEEFRDRCPYDWKALDLTGRNAHTSGQVPSHGPVGSTGRSSEGFRYGSSCVGARHCRVPDGFEAVRPLFVRHVLADRGAGEPAA